MNEPQILRKIKQGFRDFAKNRKTTQRPVSAVKRNYIWKTKHEEVNDIAIVKQAVAIIVDNTAYGGRIIAKEVRRHGCSKP